MSEVWEHRPEDRVGHAEWRPSPAEEALRLAQGRIIALEQALAEMTRDRDLILDAKMRGEVAHAEKVDKARREGYAAGVRMVDLGYLDQKPL